MYWQCHVNFLRCMVTLDKHCKYTKYELRANTWIIFRNHDLAYTVMILLGDELKDGDFERHGKQYHKAMGFGKKFGKRCYYIKKVAQCKTRIKLSVHNKVMPLHLTEDDDIRVATEALEAATVSEIKCNLCVPQQPSETAAGDDDGGCIHFALNKCVPDVLCVSDLDNQIKPLFQEKKKTPEYNLTLEQCGIPGVTWHSECIVRALKSKYGVGGFSWTRHNRAVLNERGQGKFYVTGELNRKLFPDSDQDGNWAHVVCVDTDNDRFYDSNNTTGKKFKAWFKQGPNCYMNIWRVYKLEILTPNKHFIK